MAVLASAGVLVGVSIVASDRANRTTNAHIQNFHLHALALIAEIDNSLLTIRQAPDMPEVRGKPGILRSIRDDLAALSDLYKSDSASAYLSVMQRTRERFDRLYNQQVPNRGGTLTDDWQQLGFQLEQLNRLHSISADAEIAALADRQGQRLAGLLTAVIAVTVIAGLLTWRIIRLMVAAIHRQAAAEQALRNSEERLQQIQRIEALGRLVGGVAHDFNNLLTAIAGNMSLLQVDGSLGKQQKEHLDEIEKAVERAGSLTRQLLTFSRRQPVQLQVRDLNRLAHDIEPLLRRLIGENLVFTTSYSADPAHADVDPSQMEQVILNLVINARDALPNGGNITLDVANVTVEGGDSKMPDIPAGAYCRIRVTDNGVGMDEATLDHIFDPFFTTKSPNRGTGLGLSMVHGIVKMSDGHIMVDSKPGEGTTIDVLLPRQERHALEQSSGPEIETVTGGSETILIAEDDHQIRSMLTEGLQRLGYRVLAGADGREALRISSDYPDKIDLILTDVIMPELNGHEFAQEALKTRPDTRVIMMSGYTDDIIFNANAAGIRYPLFMKPFNVGELALYIREVLERSGSTAQIARTA